MEFHGRAVAIEWLRVAWMGLRAGLNDCGGVEV